MAREGLIRLCEVVGAVDFLSSSEFGLVGSVGLDELGFVYFVEVDFCLTVLDLEVCLVSMSLISIVSVI